MIQVILFDIVGTLINIDNNDFMRNFLGILAPRFAQLIPPDKFSKFLLKSILAAQKEPKPGSINMQTFYEEFTKLTGQSLQTLRPIFEEFYTSDFPALKCLVQINPLGIKVVELAIQQGFLTALASNPVLPLIAVQEQIRWVGLTPEHFKLIPALDNFHFCKPNQGFFEELAESLGVTPENCLIVSGNTEDIVCRELGMKLFLIGSFEGEKQADYAGQLDDLYRLISQGNL